MIQYDFWTAPALAANEVANRYPDARMAEIALADDICENRFTFRGHWEMERTHVPVVFNGEIGWDVVPADDPEWVFAFNRHTAFVTLGKAWRFTGNSKYAAAYARLIQDWMKRVPLTEESKKTTWRSIETGLRCENWLRALALFSGSDALTPGLLAEIETCLRTHAAWLLEAHGGFQMLSNWGVLQDHGLFLLGLALDEPDWCATAAARLEQELGVQVFDDGSHWEQSPLYHCEVLHCCLDTVLAARRAGYNLPGKLLERTHKMCTALAYWLRPDGKLLCQSDSDEVDARDLLGLGAVLFEDAELKAYAAQELLVENLWDFADWAGAYAALPRGKRHGTVALPDSGNYMLWDGDGDNAGFLHFHCGCLGSGHGHADQLHIDLVCGGETILADSGRYTYVDGPLRRALKSPAGHNVVRVNDCDFSVCSNSWGYSALAEPLKGEYKFTPVADYASGAHLGYMNQGVLPRRRVLRLGGGLWAVCDTFDIAADAERRYQQYFHFGPTGSVTLENGQALFRGQSSSATLAFPGGGRQWTLYKAPVSREYNRLEEGDCLRGDASGESFTSFITVVATGPAGAPPALEVRLLPVFLVSTGKELPRHKAEAVEILHNGRRFVLMLAYAEIISEVDMLSAGGCVGYGKVLVFGPDTPEGLCLAW